MSYVKILKIANKAKLKMKNFRSANLHDSKYMIAFYLAFHRVTNLMGRSKWIKKTTSNKEIDGRAIMPA